MTEFNERIEGEIKSHEKETLERIRKEKTAKRKQLLLSMQEDWKKNFSAMNSDLQIQLSKTCINKSLLQQHELLTDLIKHKKTSETDLQRRLDEINELIKENDLL